MNSPSSPPKAACASSLTSGGLTIQLGTQPHPALCELEVETGIRTLILARKGWSLPYRVEVRRGGGREEEVE